MEIDTTTHKTNGRKTTNDALITLSRAGAITMVLTLCAGTVADAAPAAGTRAGAA